MRREESHTEAEISYVSQIPQISQIYSQISSFGWDKGTTNYTNYTNFLVADMENYIEFHESIAKRCAGFDQMPPFGTCEACRKEFV